MYYSINTDELKNSISGKEIEIAKQLGILVEGIGKEHKQYCPFCRGTSGERFYVRTGEKTTFHCRQKCFNGDLITLVMKSYNVDFKTAVQQIASIAGYVTSIAPHRPSESKAQTGAKQFQDGTVRKTEYIYTDTNGNPHHKIVRLDGIEVSTGKPDKTCCQYKMVLGKWVKGAPAMKYPYRLPDVLQAKTVFIVEGEKTADCLNAVGIRNAIATTSPGGVPSGKLWEGWHTYIENKAIRIFPDNDDPGRKYARTVTTVILETNPSADVKIVELPGLPPKGDFVDWYEADATDIVKRLSELCTNATAITPDEVATWSQAESAQGSAKNKPVNQFLLARGTDEILWTEYPPMRWIVEGLIPEGLTILAGKSKAGKSWLLLQMALAVAKGQSFLGFDTVTTKAVYLALEDSERRVQSRMKYQQQSGSVNLKILDRWEGGLDALVRDLPAIPDVQLLIIDTWGRFIGKGKNGKKVDGNDYHDVTENVGRLHSIAKEHGIAVIVCTHTKKGVGADDWLDDVIGSVALVGCADTILKFSRVRKSDEGNLDVTGRDVHEQSIGIHRDDCWRWNRSEEQDPGRRAMKGVLESRSPEWVPWRDIRRACPNFDAERILGELIRDGEVESDKREKTTFYRMPHATCIKNTGKYAQVASGMSSLTPENDFSTPDVVEGFGDYRNPESAPLESVSHPEPSAVCCENCEYRDGRMGSLCRAGKVQQNRTDCPSFKLRF